MTSTPTVPKPSFRDLEPLEEGGRVARLGLEFQDHVAARACLRMLLPAGPTEVWCEAEDDIVLVWNDDRAELFEFVQVKSNNLGQAWTVSKLCERESSRDATGTKTLGRSIVEKSLAHDRGEERCRFRIVTCWEPDPVLDVLKLTIDTPERTKRQPDIDAAVTAISAKLGACTSPKNNGLDFWAANTHWEVRAGIEDVQNASLLDLEQILVSAGFSLAPDQRRELYERLLRRVRDASLAAGRTHRQAKQLPRAALRTWLLTQVQAIQRPPHAGTSAALEHKFQQAGIVDSSTIEAAKEQRRRYLQEVRQPKYLAADDREALEDAVSSRLLVLKTQLDAGEVEDNGYQFHSRCQKEVLGLRTTQAFTSPPSDTLLLGCMYNVMNRCLHRLAKAAE